MRMARVYRREIELYMPHAARLKPGRGAASPHPGDVAKVEGERNEARGDSEALPVDGAATGEANRLQDQQPGYHDQNGEDGESDQANLPVSGILPSQPTFASILGEFMSADATSGS